MAPLLQLLSLFVLLSPSHSESKGGPRDSVCASDNKGLIPRSQHGGSPKFYGEEDDYKVTITLIKESNNQIVDCVEEKKRVDYIVRINATKYFKGFIITSTEPGTGYPANFVGRFYKKPHLYKGENLVHLCGNAISHSDILKDNPIDLKWKSASGRETEFLYTIMFSRYTWMANLTTRIPVCKPKPKCLSRVEPDSSGSGSGSPKMNVTDHPGSAVPESKCKLVNTELKPTELILPIGSTTVKYHCTGYVMRCKGNCPYCDQNCTSVHSKMVRPKYTCKTTDDNPSIATKTLPKRSKVLVQEDKECRCLGKYDIES